MSYRVMPGYGGADCTWRLSVPVLLALIAAGGCGSQSLFPVSGKVTHKGGSPLAAGMIIFEPVDQKFSARGEIQPDGSFQLGTHADRDGAAPGDYKVLIAPPPLPEEGKRLRAPVPAKYQSLATSPLKLTVTRDRNKNKFQIELE